MWLNNLNAYQRTREVLKQKQTQAEKHKPILEKLEFGDIVRKKFQSSGRRKLANIWNPEKFVVVGVRDEVVTIVSNTDGKQFHINRCNLQKIGGKELEDIPKANITADSDSD